MTVSELARGCGISRSTILYYESIGLMGPAARSASNYRRYSDRDAERLRIICSYRSAGLKLDDISALLHRPATDAGAVLRRRLAEIGNEVETLRSHQRAILKLLQSKGKLKAMTKDKWVEIMRATGF